MAKFRSEANKAIVEMLKAQQESINEAAKEPEKSESQKKLEEDSKIYSKLIDFIFSILCILMLTRLDRIIMIIS